MALVLSEGTVGGRSWLEYPTGRILHETRGSESLSFPRISRDGRWIAVAEDPGGRAASGRILLVDANGREAARHLTGDYTSLRGLAWSPDNREVWFSAGDQRAERSLRAVDLNGNDRLVYDALGSVTLWDIDADGRVLLSRDTERRFTVGQLPGDRTERRLTTEEDAAAVDISPDGERILVAANFRLFLQSTRDPTQKTDLGLSGVFADALSPDGTLVLATSADNARLTVAPTGVGDPPRPLPPGRIISYSGAYWFPDSEHIAFVGEEAGDPGLRAYVQNINDGPPRLLTDRRVHGLAVSPAGTDIAVGSADGIMIWPAGGGQPRPVPNSLPDDRPVAWGENGRFLWVFHRDQVPAPVAQVDVASGARTPWRDLQPADPTGVFSITEFKVTPDGRAYFYTYRRVLSELYLARVQR
jgi:WD40 repeat protein